MTKSNMGSKAALKTAQKVGALFGKKHLYLTDGSTLMNFKCCENRSLGSLMLLEIFKKGKTWYESQGAHLPVEIKETSFFYESCERNPIAIQLLEKELQYREKVYQRAASFLHLLKAKELALALAKEKNHPLFEKLSHILNQALEITFCSQDETLGEVAIRLFELEKKYGQESKKLHTLKHDFVEDLISNNLNDVIDFMIQRSGQENKGFFNFLLLFRFRDLIERLIDDKEADGHADKLAYAALKIFQKKALQASPHLIQDLVEEVNSNEKNIVQSYLSKHESPRTLELFFEKTIAGSDGKAIEGLEKMIRGLFEIKLKEIEQLIPELFERLQVLRPENQQILKEGSLGEFFGLFKEDHAFEDAFVSVFDLFDDLFFAKLCNYYLDQDLLSSFFAAKFYLHQSENIFEFEL